MTEKVKSQTNYFMFTRVYRAGDIGQWSYAIWLTIDVGLCSASNFGLTIGLEKGNKLTFTRRGGWKRWLTSGAPTCNQGSWFSWWVIHFTIFNLFLPIIKNFRYLRGKKIVLLLNIRSTKKSTYGNPYGKMSWRRLALDYTVWFPVLALTIRPGLGLARSVTFLYDQPLVSGWAATSHRLLSFKPAAGQTLVSG